MTWLKGYKDATLSKIIFNNFYKKICFVVEQNIKTTSVISSQNTTIMSELEKYVQENFPDELEKVRRDYPNEFPHLLTDAGKPLSINTPMMILHLSVSIKLYARVKA